MATDYPGNYLVLLYSYGQIPRQKLIILPSHAECNFVGFDCIKAHPTCVPFNVEFIQGDFSQGIPAQDDRFEFLHTHRMISLLNGLNLNELLRVVKPGGWI